MVLFAVVACTDRLTAPVPVVPPAATTKLLCTADVRAGTVECANADSSAVGAFASLTRAASPGGAGSDIIMGGQNVYVTLTSSNVSYSAATQLFSFDVTVKNLIPQPIGTSDGTTQDPNGIRVFFNAPPTTTGGTGTIDYTNPAGGGSLVDGFATFTASNQAYYQYNALLAQGQTSSAKTWRLHVPSTVTTFSFVVYVDAPVQHSGYYVTVTPTPDTVAPGGTVQLSATVRYAQGQVVSNQTVTWGSSATSVATVNSSGLVTAVGVGTATITATDASLTSDAGTATIVVKVNNTAPTITAHGFNYLGNVLVSVDSAHGLLSSTFLTDPDAGQNHTVVSPAAVTTASGTLTVSANGSFTYVPAAGQTANATFSYQVSDGTATSNTVVDTLKIQGGMHWYVDNSASSSGATGTSVNPFTSLDGLSGKTTANDTIFVNAGNTVATGTPTRGTLTMLSGETLIGQGIASDITATVNGATTTMLAAGTMPSLTPATSGTATLTLNSGNTIRGVRVGSNGAAALLGSSGTFGGTLTVSNARVVATNGPALDLTGPVGIAAVSVSVDTLTSTSTTSTGLNLVNLSGSITASSSNSAITTNAAPTGAPIVVNGGTVSLTYPGGVTLTANQPLVSVTNHATGTLSLNGTLSATNGSGLAFNNANGTYSFNGSVTLNGGNAHVDINTGSTGSFTFGNTSVTSPSTTSAFRLNGSRANVTWSAGTISIGGTTGQRPIDIQSEASGTVTIGASISANATTQSGILFANNTGGTYTLNGSSQTLSTAANTAVSLTTNTGATINFTGGGLAITTTSGGGFSASGGGTVTVQGATNTITSTTGTALSVTSTTIGASGLTFKSISASGSTNGIVLSSTGSSGGLTVTGDGQSSTASTTIGRTTSKQGGGTITLGSGGTISAPTGVGVSLSSTASVVLRNMVIQNGVGGAGTGNHGISASSVTGLTLDNDLVTGFTNNMGVYTTGSSGLSVIHSEFTNNASATASASTLASSDYWNFRNDNLSGSNSITFSKFVTSLMGGFGIIQNSSVSPTITFSNDSLKSAASDSTTTGVTHDKAATGWFLDSGHSGTVTLTASNNAYDGDHIEFEVLQKGNGTINYTFSNNRLRQTTYGSFSAIYVRQLGTTVTSGLISGTMSSNAIGTSTVPASTQLDAVAFLGNTSATGGTMRTTFTNNTVVNAGAGPAGVGNALDIEPAYNGTNTQFKASGNDLEAASTTSANTYSAFQIVTHGTGTLCLDMRSNTKFLSNPQNSGADAGYFDETGTSPTVSFVTTTSGSWNSTNIASYFNAAATTVSPQLIAGTDVITSAGATNTATTTACNTP